MNFFLSLDLSKRFLVLMAVLIALTAVSARTFFVRQERASLEMRLQEKIAFINKTYALSIAAALMQKDDVMLLQVVNTLEEDQEITSVIVVDQTGEVRYHADANKIATVLDDDLVKQSLQTSEGYLTPYTNSGGRAVALVAPLKIPGLPRPLGVVRIDLTHRRIENQLASSQQRFWFIMLGSVAFCSGLVIACVNSWILLPLKRLQTALGAVNTARPEPNLPEPPDEFGKTYQAVNDLVLRFKNEGQQLSTNIHLRGEQEKAWIQQLVGSFFPTARVIVADKDNRVVADTGNGVTGPTQRRHLMDLIKDSNFATLLTDAFQKEGSVFKGAVTFQDKSYQALVLSVPLQQSVLIKTLIALQPNP